MRKIILFGLLGVILFSCEDDKPKNIEVKTKSYTVPVFNQDSAYAYIAKQVSFGPRVPGTAAHGQCADWLQNKLKKIGLESRIETFSAKRFDGVDLEGKNVVGVLNPKAKERVFVCAHWDSRFQSDYDTVDKTSPVMGADDGASGVGVAIEIARTLANEPGFNMGLDIIFFDAEDQGQNDGDVNSWGIGAQKWSNRNKGSYRPKYGILLDMVGAEGARFYQEKYSVQTAPNVVYKIWRTAENLGYGNLFIKQEGRGVVDDHYFINRNTGWPVVDIIHTNNEPGTGFGKHWHTQHDDMDVIDKNILKAVGRVVVKTLCQEDQGR